jgi:hypothetical protein
VKRSTGVELRSTRVPVLRWPSPRSVRRVQRRQRQRGSWLQRVLAALAAGLLGGGVAGAGYGLALQGASDVLEVAGTGTKSTSEVRAGDYGRAAGLGFLLGMAPGGAQSLATAEAAAASAPTAATIVETAPPPKALAAGSQPRARIGAGRPGTPVGGSPGARFIADASGNIQDLAASSRGNLNPIGQQGPIALTTGELIGVPRWKLYEMRFGGRQTPMETTFGGESVKVRLDKPPENSRIVDFKDYNWSNPKYNQRFFREVVIPRDFSQQIAKYQTIQPNVHMQFSQEPPAWVVDILTKAGATYSVVP